MNELHPIDGAVLVAYLLGITALGIWMGRRVRNVRDFFMPRRFGKAMMIAHAFGTGTASDQAVQVASATFERGLSGIWYQWMWLFSTPFYWLIAPIMRRLRAITTADVYALRYDRSVAVLSAVVGIVGLSVKIGLLLKGSSALIDSATGGTVPGELVTEPCTLPEGVQPARRHMLLTALGLEIPAPSRTSAIGFLAGWIAVAALVGGFLLIIGD